MATISGFDKQHGYDDTPEPDLIDYTKAVARMEWQSAVDAYEDGVSDIDPGPFEY